MTEPGLWDLDDVARLAIKPGERGRVERALIRALEAAAEAGHLIEEDLGLIGGALAGARAIDGAEKWPGLKGGYLVAQLLTPYREALAALRLPAAVNPADDPRPPANVSDDAPNWLSDHYGTPE